MTVDPSVSPYTKENPPQPGEVVKVVFGTNIRFGDREDYLKSKDGGCYHGGVPYYFFILRPTSQHYNCCSVWCFNRNKKIALQNSYFFGTLNSVTTKIL